MHYVPNVEQTPETIFGMQCIMIGLPSLFFAIALFMYFRYYKLNGAYHQQIQQQLMEKYELVDNDEHNEDIVSSDKPQPAQA